MPYGASIEVHTYDIASWYLILINTTRQLENVENGHICIKSGYTTNDQEYISLCNSQFCTPESPYS